MRAPVEQPLAPSPCPVCRYDYGAMTIGDALRIVREGTPAVRAHLDGGSPLLRRRPAPGVWSPLEYGAHMRDVLVAQRERIILALLEDAPHFAPLHRDERVSLLRYNEDDPGGVSAALAIGAGLLERLGRSLTDSQLARTCTYDLPQPTAVDVGWVFVHTAHEMHHHLGDIVHGLSSPVAGAE